MMSVVVISVWLLYLPFNCVTHQKCDHDDRNIRENGATGLNRVTKIGRPDFVTYLLINWTVGDKGGASHGCILLLMGMK